MYVNEFNVPIDAFFFTRMLEEKTISPIAHLQEELENVVLHSDCT